MNRRAMCGVLSVVLVAFAAAAVPGLARADGGPCSPAGTWYGSAEGTSKYLLTIVPLTGNTYSLRMEGAYTLEAYGYVRETSFHGTMEKVGDRTYRYRVMELLVWNDTGVPPADASLETDVVEGIFELNGCDDVTYTTHLFAYYFGWGFEPFVDEPNGYFLPPGETIVGTARRMAMD